MIFGITNVILLSCTGPRVDLREIDFIPPGMMLKLQCGIDMRNEEVNNKMKRLTALAAAVLDKDYDSLRGFDIESKALCSYIVKKVLRVDDGMISTFFRMPVHTMRDRWEGIAIQVEINDDMRLMINQVERIWIALTDKSLRVWL